MRALKAVFVIVILLVLVTGLSACKNKKQDFEDNFRISDNDEIMLKFCLNLSDKQKAIVCEDYTTEEITKVKSEYETKINVEIGFNEDDYEKTGKLGYDTLSEATRKGLSAVVCGFFSSLLICVIGIIWSILEKQNKPIKKALLIALMVLVIIGAFLAYVMSSGIAFEEAVSIGWNEFKSIF